MRRMIDWLGSILADVVADDRPVPGQPPRMHIEPTPCWMAWLNCVLLVAVLALMAATLIAQLVIWGTR